MRQSIILSLETDHTASIKELFDRIYPAPAVTEDQYHQPVRARYVADDFQKLAYTDKTN